MPPTNGLSEPHQNVSLAFSWNYGEKYTAGSPRGSKRLVQRAGDEQAVIRKRRVEVRELLHDDLSGCMFGMRPSPTSMYSPSTSQACRCGILGHEGASRAASSERRP